MTTIILLSHDRWYEVADYDTAARTILDVYRLERDASEVANCGNFGTLGEERLIVRAERPANIVVGFERAPEIPLRDERT